MRLSCFFCASFEKPLTFFLFYDILTLSMKK